MLLCVFVCLGVVVSGQSYPHPTDPCPPTVSIASRPWCNLTASFETRTASLVQAMTLPEKLTQLSTFTPQNVTPGIPRIGLPAFPYHSEGLHGLRGAYDDLQLNATLFPQTTGLAATGNLSLISAMAHAMSMEARALSNVANARDEMFPRGAGLFYWSPTMNLCRDPRWGRCQESIGEDPAVNALYSVAFVKGFQTPPTSRPTKFWAVAATCKHLMAYSLEGWKNYTRHNFNAVVGAQDFNETYIAPFAACIRDGEPGMVMCSYPSINGVPNCAHEEVLTDVLRTSWGYSGLVVSDQGAVKDIYTAEPTGHGYTSTPVEGVAAALNAGCDQNDGPFYAQYLPTAVQQGLVNETVVDTALKRILLQRFRVGAFDPPTAAPWHALNASDLETPATLQLSLEAGQQGVTLLNNSKSVLPLSPSLGSIAVVGPFADNSEVFKGGKADYSPSFIVTVLEGVKATVAASTAVTVVADCPVTAVTGASCEQAATAAAASADVTLLVVGIDLNVEHEGTDRTEVGLPDVQASLVKAVVAAAKGNVVVVFVNGGSLSSTFVRYNVATVVEAFEPGQFGGQAIADVLFGKVSPGGALPYTVYPEDIVDQLDMTNFDMRASVGRTYRFYTGTPLWPFGYGESYSTFATAADASHSSPTTLSPSAASASHFSATVTNTGSVPAAKVVLAFARSLQPGAPLRSLFGMQRVFLAPGASTTVTFDSNPLTGVCAFCTVDTTGQRAIRSGSYVVEIGGDGRNADAPGWHTPPTAEFDVTITSGHLDMPLM